MSKFGTHEGQSDTLLRNKSPQTTGPQNFGPAPVPSDKFFDEQSARGCLSTNANASSADFFSNHVPGLPPRFVVHLLFLVCSKNILFNHVTDGCNKQLDNLPAEVEQ